MTSSEPNFPVDQSRVFGLLQASEHTPPPAPSALIFRDFSLLSRLTGHHCRYCSLESSRGSVKLLGEVCIEPVQHEWRL